VVVQQTYTLKDYKADTHNTWCPGCGDYGILTALQMALAEIQVPPHKVAVVSGIGCSGKAPHYVNAYGFHTLHGRSIPSATGMKLSNPEMTVIAVGGDGDGYGIGSGYFVNAGRRNIDFTYLVFDNEVYGLTKGHGSPTMRKGLKTKGMAEAAVQDNINPLALAISSGYTFVGRGYALNPKATSQLIAQAVAHRGTSFIDIVQTCPVYNDLHTKEYYAEMVDGKPRMYWLENTDYDAVVHDPTNAEEVIEKKLQAIGKAYESTTQIPLGCYYKIDVPTFEDQISTGRPNGMDSILHPNLWERDLSKLVDSLR